jgi:molybdate-binding protein
MHLSDAEYDKVQIALMEETCLIVDNHDRVTGFMSKKQSTRSIPSWIGSKLTCLVQATC